MRLLYAIDLRAKDLWRMREVSRWAERLRASVDLAYVDPFGDYAPYVLDPAVAEHLRHGLDKARARDREVLQGALEHLPPANRGEVHVVSGDPAQGICDLAAGYDALIVSTRGRTGAARMWLGSVAERIVRTHEGDTIVLNDPLEQHS